MKKRKPKRKPILTQKVADNIVAFCDKENLIRIDAAVERGRTIGRLEALGERCARFVADDRMHPEAQFIIGHADAIALLPILRAEIARLRSAKP